MTKHTPIEKKIDLAGKRALEEAVTRNRKKSNQRAMAKEYGGRDGPEPTRFGDWEKKGIVSDF